jgi:hypothetical protein
MSMPRRPSRVQEDVPKYYDRRGVLREIKESPVEFALDDELRRAILKGERARRLQNLSIKLDAAQIHALRKIATMKAIPYQTLIRQWLAEGVRRELRLGHSQPQSEIPEPPDAKDAIQRVAPGLGPRFPWRPLVAPWR